MITVTVTDALGQTDKFELFGPFTDPHEREYHLSQIERSIDWALEHENFAAELRDRAKKVFSDAKKGND